jgi:hypothetical protein
VADLVRMGVELRRPPDELLATAFVGAKRTKDAPPSAPGCAASHARSSGFPLPLWKIYLYLWTYCSKVMYLREFHRLAQILGTKGKYPQSGCQTISPGCHEISFLLVKCEIDRMILDQFAAAPRLLLIATLAFCQFSVILFCVPVLTLVCGRY